MSTKTKPTKQPAMTPAPNVSYLQQESQRLRQTNELLTQKVKAHTNALKRSNEQLEQEIAEHKKTEERLQTRLAFDRILTNISTQFINLATDEIDENINQALEKIGQFANYDRSYIYLFAENGRALRNSHDWCNPNSPHTLEDFKLLPADLFQNWLPQLHEQKIILLQNLQDTPNESNNEQKLLQMQGIRSALIIPLVYGKETLGFFGLDSSQPFVAGQLEKTDSLKVVGAIFVSALMRKKAEETLSEERNFAQQIMATMGQGLITTTVEGTFDFINPAFACMLGYLPEELMGQTALDLTHPEDHQQVIQAQMQNLEGLDTAYEIRLLKLDGSPVYVLMNSVPNYNRQGKVVGTIATVTDLTERRNAEAQTQANAEEVNELYQAAIQLFKPGTVQELSTQIATIAIDEFQLDSCGVLLLKEPVRLGTDRLTIQSTNTFNHLLWMAREGRFYGDAVDSLPLYGEGLIATAVRQAEIIYAPDVTEDPRYIPDNTSTQSELVIPLRAYNLIIGAIDLQSPQLNGFDERTQRMMSVFAEHAGLALETARLYDQLHEHAQALEAQINERNKIELALRASEHRYKQLVESATDMIYRTDARGYVTYANPVTIHTLGYDREADLIGRHYSDFVHPDFQKKIEQAHAEQHLRHIANTYYEFVALSKKGQKVWLGQNVQLIKEHGLITGYQALARDVTQRQETEEELRRRSSELNATNAKLAKAVRAKDEFLANMSHELRTPLSAILGKSEILLEHIHGPLTDKQESSIKMIEKSGRHLLELINDILDMAKIEAGKIKLDVQKVSLAVLCDSSLQFVREMAHKKQIKLHSEIDHAIQVCHADERRLKQILINLLSNAVKFTPVGGKVGLHILADKTRDTVLFQVWDTGIGISAEDMNQLFKPFVQLDSSLARCHEGTGLGLSLVYHLTEMHGGSISLESEVNVGSCFTVTLPQNLHIDTVDLQEQAKTDQSLLPDKTYAPGEAPHILLVEDNEANIETVSEYLSVWGYRLTVVSSGLEALKQIHAETPDLILMDIQIPELDGITAIRQLRQEKAYKNIPIIALTALAMHNDRKRCLEAGANEYMSKPIQLRELVMHINQLLIESKLNEKESTNV